MGGIGDRIFGSTEVEDIDLIEGSEESRRAAREARLRRARVDAARAGRKWRELRPDQIERHGRYVVDQRDGKLYEALRGVQVWANGNPQHDLNPNSADAFIVEDDDVRFLRRARNVGTIEDLRRREADHDERAAKTQAKADAKAERREQELAAYRSDQPKVDVTLADVVGHDLPTIRAAAQAILDHGGALDVRRDGVSVQLPERLAPNDGDHARIHADLMDAVRVVTAAKILPPAVASSSTKDLVDRLPDKAIGVDGWPAS